MSRFSRLTSFNPLMKDGIASRPRLSEYSRASLSVGEQRPGIMQPKSLIDIRNIYNLVEKCSSLDKAIMTIRDYSWKDGIEWIPKFSLRCRQCQHEHPRLSRPVECDKCGSSESFTPPPEEERQKADAFFRRMDEEGRTLEDICKMESWHRNIADEGYIITPSNYTLDKDGNIVDWEPMRKVWVADPRNFRRVGDDLTGKLGGRWFICLRHRPGRHYNEDSATWDKNNYTVLEHPGTCTTSEDGVNCGMRLYPVWFVSMDPQYSQTEPAEYYIGDVELADGVVLQEVINCQKFHPSYDGGRSPIVPLWHIGNALCDMEKFMGTFYKENRNPRKIGFVPTANFKGFEQTMREVQNRTVSAGGHGFYWLPYDPGISGGQRQVQLMDLDPLPTELQYMAVREEFHRRIAMTYDITPAFHGGVDPVGGQSAMNPLQWQVTVLGVNKEQAIPNNRIFPKLLTWLKVKEWSLVLREAEEDDEMKKQQVLLLEGQVAMLRQNLGFMPLGIDAQGHYIYPSKPQMMGGMNAPFNQGPQGEQGAEAGMDQGQAQGGGGSQEAAPTPQAAEESAAQSGLPGRVQ